MLLYKGNIRVLGTLYATFSMEVEDYQEGQENLSSLNTGGEDDNGWVVRQSGVDPGQEEHDKAGVAKFLILGVATKLCELQPMVSKVMKEQNHGSNSVEA